MTEVTIKQLLEAGVHFGHHTTKWNPKMAKYIFGSRNNIYILDLQKTAVKIKESYAFVKDEVAEGKTVLFVGTKKQAQDVIVSESKRCGMFCVADRWWGGMLTNFSTIQKSIARLRELDRLKEGDGDAKLTNKESGRLEKERKRLHRGLSGIRDMGELPGLLFIIDTVQEHTAVLEANKLKIPIVALVDTNCDPDMIDSVIPGNDDAIRAIKLITSIIADAVLEGKTLHEKKGEEEKEERTEDKGEEKTEKGTGENG